MSAAASIRLTSRMTFVRRLTLRAAAVLHFLSTSFLSWKFRPRTARSRTVVITELRTFRVEAERRRIVVNTDRRDASVPRDRETI